jgi:hypothetical protein
MQRIFFFFPFLLVSSLSFSWALRAGDVVINEIHYDPPEKTRREEFIELFNSGGAAVDLSGWYFSAGIAYTFPPGTVIGPGEHLVIAEDPESITRSFGLSKVLGPYSGFLSASGERIELRNAAGGKEDEVDYKVGFPWPVGSAGRGSSMELIHPFLDNDLGGSWRASGSLRTLPEERRCYFPQEDTVWRYRKGTSEASDPPWAWRSEDFVEDDTWLTGQTSIGFGDDDDNTLIDDMVGNYTSIYLRRFFTVPEDEPLPPLLKLRLFVDDGCILWVNGIEIHRFRMTAGDKAYNDIARSGEARWEEFEIANPAAFLRPGRNILAIHAFNASLSSNDFSIDAQLCIPARSELPPAPTPGEENSVYSENAPPQIRQVSHGEGFPPSGAPIRVSAKVTDPDGVASVRLRYQLVPPGGFIPAYLPHEPQTLMARPLDPRPPNSAFEDPARWSEIELRDDGRDGDEVARDGIYTGAIPPQPNRTLVRYRLTATDARGLAVTVPYPDDRSLNFAAFVYGGVPPYATTRTTVRPEGPGYVYPAEVMNSLPVYFLITRAEDIARCVAYNSAWQIPKSNEAARDAFNWEGAFAYDGEVYDHIRFRLRQANDRYGGGGKRSWRIRFNKGRYAELHDLHGRKYPTRWRTLNTGKMFDNKGVGNFGLTETLNDILWNLVGVPAPFMHTFHFRVVRGAEEAPQGATGQYYGDFWGMATAIEDYDPRFLDAHGMADGNLYKLKDGIFDGRQLKRNQGRFAVTTDEDFQNIRANLRPQRPDAWIDLHVNYPRWYPYHAVVEAIRHYDFVPADSHSKNRAWYFEPAEDSRLGRLWTLPWDHDASWGPNWNDGVDYSKQAIFGIATRLEHRKQYRSVIREFRNLIWQEEVIHAAIDDLAAMVAAFSQADRDRWRGAPADAGTQDFGTLEAKVLDMKRFAFVGWSGGSGPTVPAGGRAAHLDNLANAERDAAEIPRTPVVTAAGPAGFPVDRLHFTVSPFSDPQGDDTFAAMEWRLAEVTDPAAPAYDPQAPRLFEWNAVWTSGRLEEFQSEVTVPAAAVQPGRAYRIRARMMDSTSRWSHWSQPVHFIAGESSTPLPQVEHLRVTEVMYNPAGGGDAEFIEIQNVGPEALSLEDVRFTDGIEFAFAGSAVASLAPGEYAVVVKNLSIFASRYDTSRIKIAGEYRGRLDDGGERIILAYGAEHLILAFTYDDAWYPETDGGGHSLVIVDALASRELWSQKRGWQPSRSAGGSPGREDGVEPAAGLQLPGDITQDGALNITDAIALLGYLFQGTPALLPCEGGTLAGEGNRALIDLDGDGRITLTDAIYVLRFLFQSGPAPVLGTGCTPLPGCPERCSSI